MNQERRTPASPAEPGAWQSPPSANTQSRHVVRFYEESSFPDSWIADFIWTGIRADESIVLIMGPTHLAAVKNCLASRGAPLDDLERSGRLVVFDARAVR